MLTVALTGGIGCGKTLACKIFSEYGTPIIDTDQIARELVRPEQPALQEIIENFGSQVIQPDGSLNRKQLATIVFSDCEQRKKLESILHPRIRHSVKSQLESLHAAYVIIAIPLLIESGQESIYDRVLVIDCTQQQQIDRTQQRDARSIDEIKAIIKSQVSRDERLRIADDVIDNSGDQATLRAQIARLHEQYSQ